MCDSKRSMLVKIQKASKLFRKLGTKTYLIKVPVLGDILLGDIFFKEIKWIK